MGKFVMSSERRRPALVFTVALAVLLLPCAFARAFDVVLNAQGEFMDAYLVNGTAYPPTHVFIDPAPANAARRAASSARRGTCSGPTSDPATRATRTPATTAACSSSFPARGAGTTRTASSTRT